MLMVCDICTRRVAGLLDARGRTLDQRVERLRISQHGPLQQIARRPGRLAHSEQPGGDLVVRPQEKSEIIKLGGQHALFHFRRHLDRRLQTTDQILRLRVLRRHPHREHVVQLLQFEGLAQVGRSQRPSECEGILDLSERLHHQAGFGDLCPRVTVTV